MSKLTLKSVFDVVKRTVANIYKISNTAFEKLMKMH